MYRNQTVDVSTVRSGVMFFSSGDGNVCSKPCPGSPYSAVNIRNEEGWRKGIPNGVEYRYLITVLQFGRRTW